MPLALGVLLSAVLLQVPGPAQVPPRQAGAQEPQGQAGAQEPQGGREPARALQDERLQALVGLTVREIRIVELDREGRPRAHVEAGRLLKAMKTRAGAPLDPRLVSSDVAVLARDFFVQASCSAVKEGDGVVLVLTVLSQDRIYDSVEFRGLRGMTQTAAEELLGLGHGRLVTDSEARAMKNVLLARYDRDGYAFCNIDLVEEPVAGGKRASKLVFRIDEGPKVTVREVRFEGNSAFPGDPPMGFLNAGDYLTRGSSMSSKGSWGFARGQPFSMETVEEDLDKLRLFYRGRGYLDATVELSDVAFSSDHDEVDLTFSVFEGPRYRIRKLAVQPVDEQGRPLAPGASFYPPKEVEAVLGMKEGDWYEQDRIRADLRAVEDFYGARGHPMPMGEPLPQSFRVLGSWPLETYVDGARLDLTYRILEGTPKTLREIVIRGNAYTRDRVIRRKVFAKPGERIDMTLLRKTRRALEQLRYFEDPLTFEGPRLGLKPVPEDQDAVDLSIDLKEGMTSEFRWGIGISTGAGASANIEFKKRNFDLWSPPSSWNPVTMFEEIFDNRAFHGGGQTLQLFLAPGTEISQFGISFTEPDLLGEHFDTLEGRVNGQRRLRRWREGYTTDTLGFDLGISRNFTERMAGGIGFREESVHVGDLAADAPRLAFDARGRTELRAARMTLEYHDLDDARRPSDGLRIGVSGQFFGGFLGGEQNLAKGTAYGHYYVPLHEDLTGRRWVLHAETFFGVADAFGGSEDVFLTERFYMGAYNLRGFDYRGAGPSQFGRAIGGGAMLTSTLELGFPLLSSRMEREYRDRELIRGVVFSDFGLLGTRLSDSSFGEPRLSVGFGVRIELPVLEIPIAFDLGWPLLYEETDDRQQFYFSISR